MTNQGLSESELQAAAIEAQPLEEVTPPAPEVDKAEEVPARIWTTTASISTVSCHSCSSTSACWNRRWTSPIRCWSG